MREFKLRKWYPSLPEDWKNKEPMVVVEREMGYQPHPSIQGVSYACVHPQEMINTEFWEELKPKEYEILSFLSHNKTIINYGEEIASGEMFPETVKVTEDLLDSKVFSLKINSIKRLSDGEIFSIGDKIRKPDYGKDVFTLLEIEYESAPADKGTGRLTFIHDHKFLGKWISLEKLEKVKSLFTEEVIEYPVGTKVLNKETDCVYTKKEDGWYKPMEKTSYTDSKIHSSKNINIIDDGEKKEYEILSFKDVRKENWNDDRIWSKYKNKGFKINNTTPVTEESMLNVGMCVNSGDFVIHSIKRLSDGEVFTVGDTFLENTCKIVVTSIDKFILKDDGSLSIRGVNTGRYSLGCLKHHKPLFTTEDGVDMYDGDTYYWVGDDDYRNNSIIKKWEISEHCKIEHNHVSFVVGVHTFSTKKAAEEYILMNKKLLSANDLLEYLKETDNEVNVLGKYFMDFLKKKAGQ